MKNKKLTENQFETSIQDFPRLQETGYSTSYHCLVLGWTAAEAAAEFKVSQSYIRKTVNQIHDNYITKHSDCPKGWVQYVACVPKNKLDDIKKIELDAKKSV